MSIDYLELARDVTQKAEKKGAHECDCFIETGRELTIRVRNGQVEAIERASSRGLGIRFFIGKRLGFGFTTDFSAASIDGLIEQCHAFALTSTPDAVGGIPDFVKVETKDMEINDPDIDSISMSRKTDLAIACEAAAYEYDKRIKHTYGSSYQEEKARVILAKMGSDPIYYDSTAFDITCVPVAEDQGERRLGVWFSAERFFADLEPARHVGVTAAQRATQMLGARHIPTQKVSVVFDPMTGSEVVKEIFEALDGQNVLRGMSFLRDKMGKKVGSDLANFVDDGRMPRRIGSRPFDAEGIPTRRIQALERGVLKSYFYDYRSSRKAGVKPSGNARRGFESIPDIAENNFYLVPGSVPRDTVIGSVQNGILVTRLLGFGVNITTGDYSRGAEGLWISNGRITHPVDGITVAGNLADMLRDIHGVASDLHFFGRFGSPTFVVGEMTVAGD